MADKKAKLLEEMKNFCKFDTKVLFTRDMATKYFDQSFKTKRTGDTRKILDDIKKNIGDDTKQISYEVKGLGWANERSKIKNDTSFLQRTANREAEGILRSIFGKTSNTFRAICKGTDQEFNIFCNFLSKLREIGNNAKTSAEYNSIQQKEFLDILNDCAKKFLSQVENKSLPFDTFEDIFDKAFKNIINKLPPTDKTHDALKYYKQTAINRVRDIGGKTESNLNLDKDNLFFMWQNENKPTFKDFKLYIEDSNTILPFSEGQINKAKLLNQCATNFLNDVGKKTISLAVFQTTFNAKFSSVKNPSDSTYKVLDKMCNIVIDRWKYHNGSSFKALNTVYLRRDCFDNIIIGTSVYHDKMKMFINKAKDEFNVQLDKDDAFIVWPVLHKLSIGINEDDNKIDEFIDYIYSEDKVPIPKPLSPRPSSKRPQPPPSLPPSKPSSPPPSKRPQPPPPPPRKRTSPPAYQPPPDSSKKKNNFK